MTSFKLMNLSHCLNTGKSNGCHLLDLLLANVCGLSNWHLSEDSHAVLGSSNFINQKDTFVATNHQFSIQLTINKFITFAAISQLSNAEGLNLATRKTVNVDTLQICLNFSDLVVFGTTFFLIFLTIWFTFFSTFWRCAPLKFPKTDLKSGMNAGKPCLARTLKLPKMYKLNHIFNLWLLVWTILWFFIFFLVYVVVKGTHQLKFSLLLRSHEHEKRSFEAYSD